MKRTSLSEARVQQAFSGLDWHALQIHLDDVSLDASTLNDLLGHLRRFSGFIIRYPNPAKEGRRDAFLQQLHTYVAKTQSTDAAARLADEVALLSQIEQGYRSILATLDQAEISKLPAEARTSGCLNWALLACAKVLSKLEALISGMKKATQKEHTWQSSPTIADDNGLPISVDAAMDSIVKATSTTLIMETHRNGWESSTGQVVLPALPQIDEGTVMKAVESAHLAMIWRRWQQTEERRRFIGGTLRQSSAPDLPPWAPAEATASTEYSIDGCEFYDYASNERLLDRFGQQYMEMLVETDIERHVSPITGNVPLLPDGAVSLAEVHSAANLGDILKYEIPDDQERPGGLRLVEWLRGYAVLQQVAENSHSKDHGLVGLVPTLERQEISATLTRCGLSKANAAHFIDSVTFSVSSEDLFDAPLIVQGATHLMLFGPALLVANLASVVLSTLATLRQPLAKKGTALEKWLVSFLARHKLHARGFEVSRGGEQYEYDAVLVWDEYVFVFECKNRALSRNNPVNAYYFNLGVQSAIRQVQRLANALQQYPDILRNELGIDPGTKQIIPIVLHSLPYSRNGATDGVYCTDSSSLTRFLSQRYLFFKVPHRIREGATVLHRVALASFWAGDTPSATDFLAQLQAPFQLQLLQGHTRQEPAIFPISTTHFVSALEYVRDDWSLDSITRILSLSADDVRETVAVIGQAVRNAKRRQNERPHATQGAKQSQAKRNRKRKAITRKK